MRPSRSWWTISCSGALALSPATATGVGLHRYRDLSLDDLLDDFSPAGIAASQSFLRDIEHRIAALDTASLDAEQGADLEVMRDALGASRLELDEIQSYRHNPTTYVELVGNALYTPYVLQYAPAPERYRHIISRLNKIPAFLAQAQANLQDAPEVWNRVAQEENSGNMDLIEKTLREDCPSGERMRYDQAAAAAITALRGFNRWLEDNLAKRVSDWRLGKERYAKKFRFVLETGKTPETLLAEAEADLVKTRAEIARLAAPKTVEQALADVARRHASPETFIPAARQALVSATAFVKAKDLLTLPAAREPAGHRDAGVHARLVRRRGVQSGAGVGAAAGGVLLGDADSGHLAAGAHRLEIAGVQRFGGAASDGA